MYGRRERHRREGKPERQTKCRTVSEREVKERETHRAINRSIDR